MRVLVDTNVLIAAFIARGLCADLFEYLVLHHQVLTSEFILEEVRQKLLGKFKFKKTDVVAILALLKERSAEVAETRVPKDACRDPDDLPVLGAALGGRCDCLVTGDQDLLVLKNYQGVPIVAPGQFWSFEKKHP